MGNIYITLVNGEEYIKWCVKHFKKMGMLKLVDRPRLGRGEINSYKFESYYP